VLNIDKFQLTKNGIAPSQQILTAIRNFLVPEKPDARSRFGPVNQVAWAYSIVPIMEPFCELVKGAPHQKSF